jgi:2'-5' RNA ligase
MNKENLKELYTNLHNKTYVEILDDNYFIDELIDSPSDQRFGLTILIRPNEKIKIEIENLLNRISEIEPEEYYYPKSDLHVTALSIISCYSGFDLSKISINEYSEIIVKSLKGIENFEIEFKGITLANSGILIKGYPTNNSLDLLREKLRLNFKQVNLEQSIDSRYSISTAHITVVRFRKKLKNKKVFLNLVEQFKEYNFGKSPVENLELVYNDWYQKAENVKILNHFKI